MIRDRRTSIDLIGDIVAVSIIVADIGFAIAVIVIEAQRDIARRVEVGARVIFIGDPIPISIASADLSLPPLGLGLRRKGRCRPH